MFTRKRKGMTLIEVILAMAIFAIMAMTFISIFTSSLLWISAAGDKGEAYNMSQQDVEQRIALEEPDKLENLVLEFGEEAYSIRGELLETTQSSMQRDSTLSTFVPYLPTITLDPRDRNEGDLDTLVKVSGKYTHFTKGTTKIELFDISGEVLIQGNVVAKNVSDTYLEFDLVDGFGKPLNLLNSEYIVKITTTNIEGSDDEVSRARYIVNQPRFIISGISSTGDSEVYISSNGVDWVKRTDLPGLNPGNNINAITSGSNTYVIVGQTSSIMYSKNYQGWKTRMLTPEENLNDATWSSNLGKFYIVGEYGRVYSSETGHDWTYITTTGGSSLYGIETISIDDTSIIIAVGDGIILTSANEINWLPTIVDGIFLNSVSAGNNRVIAVGYDKNETDESNKGVIYDSISKNKILDTVPKNVLNDIAYVSGASDHNFIAVGDGGSIYRINISDGNESIVPYKLGDKNLIGIYSQLDEVIIISDQSELYYSQDSGVSFTKVELDDPTIKFKSVGGDR